MPGHIRTALSRPAVVGAFGHYRSYVRSSCRYVSTKPRSSTRTHYDVLGIGRDAKHAEIKKQYYRLCFDYHPDRLRNQLMGENAPKLSEAEIKQREAEINRRFQEISEAYHILGHAERRKAYDQSLLGNQYESVVTGYSGAGYGGHAFRRAHDWRAHVNSEAERRRWEEACRPQYRSSAGDALRGKRWQRSSWINHQAHYRAHYGRFERGFDNFTKPSGRRSSGVGAEQKSSATATNATGKSHDTKHRQPVVSQMSELMYIFKNSVYVSVLLGVASSMTLLVSMGMY
jgi:DnaJ-class molecular chaperone